MKDEVRAIKRAGKVGVVFRHLERAQNQLADWLGNVARHAERDVDCSGMQGLDADGKPPMTVTEAVQWYAHEG